MVKYVDKASAVFLGKIYNVFYGEIEDNNIDEYANNIYATLSEVIQDITAAYDVAADIIHGENENGRIKDSNMIQSLLNIAKEFDEAKVDLKLQCETEISRATKAHDKDDKEQEK